LKPLFNVFCPFLRNQNSCLFQSNPEVISFYTSFAKQLCEITISFVLSLKRYQISIFNDETDSFRIDFATWNARFLSESVSHTFQDFSDFLAMNKACDFRESNYDILYKYFFVEEALDLLQNSFPHYFLSDNDRGYEPLADIFFDPLFYFQNAFPHLQIE